VRAGPLARKSVKVAALPLGVRSRRPGDVVVLLYHRVGPAVGEVEISPVMFERQLQHLAKYEQVRSLDDALANGHGGVVLSFDDGTPDFAESVVPLLDRYRLPAVLYLATALADAGGVTWTQLRDAVSTGLVTVGSHTHSHADLSRAREEEAEEEMRMSKEKIEDRLGIPCRHFAYPWAVGSPSADRVARRHFASAALHAWRTNRAGRIDPHRLGRVPILRADGGFFFAQKVRGRLNGERFVYRVLRRGPWERM
jgi:peptidoglycan/xylan/chitin deacetylase (PgdA/CDA1 family)